MRVNKKFYSSIFAVLVSIVMSFFMSGVLTLVNTGLDAEFWTLWLTRAFPISFSVSLPISLAFVPLIRKVVDKITAA